MERKQKKKAKVKKVKDKFTLHLEYASKVVKSWPRWKQSILGSSTVSSWEDKKK